MPDQIGETIRLLVTITNVDGDASDPATVKISINLPDGESAVALANMTKSETGSYYYDYLIPSTLGDYNWNVTAVGSGGRITIVKDSFSATTAI